MSGNKKQLPSPKRIEVTHSLTSKAFQAHHAKKVKNLQHNFQNHYDITERKDDAMLDGTYNNYFNKKDSTKRIPGDPKSDPFAHDTEDGPPAHFPTRIKTSPYYENSPVGMHQGLINPPTFNNFKIDRRKYKKGRRRQIGHAERENRRVVSDHELGSLLNRFLRRVEVKQMRMAAGQGTVYQNPMGSMGSPQTQSAFAFGGGQYGQMMSPPGAQTAPMMNNFMQAGSAQGSPTNATVPADRNFGAFGQRESPGHSPTNAGGFNQTMPAGGAAGNDQKAGAPGSPMSRTLPSISSEQRERQEKILKKANQDNKSSRTQTPNKLDPMDKPPRPSAGSGDLSKLDSKHGPGSQLPSIDDVRQKTDTVNKSDPRFFEVPDHEKDLLSEREKGNYPLERKKLEDKKKIVRDIDGENFELASKRLGGSEEAIKNPLKAPEFAGYIKESREQSRFLRVPTSARTCVMFKVQYDIVGKHPPSNPPVEVHQMHLYELDKYLELSKCDKTTMAPVIFPDYVEITPPQPRFVPTEPILHVMKSTPDEVVGDQRATPLVAVTASEYVNNRIVNKLTETVDDSITSNDKIFSTMRRTKCKLDNVELKVLSSWDKDIDMLKNRTVRELSAQNNPEPIRLIQPMLYAETDSNVTVAELNKQNHDPNHKGTTLTGSKSSTDGGLTSGPSSMAYHNNVGSPGMGVGMNPEMQNAVAVPGGGSGMGMGGGGSPAMEKMFMGMMQTQQLLVALLAGGGGGGKNLLKNLQDGKGGKTGFNLNAAVNEQPGGQQAGGNSGEGKKEPPPVDGIPVSAVNSKRGDRDANEVPPHKKKELFTKCRNNRYKEVESMFASGTPAVIADKHGNSCLHIACQNGEKRMVKVCLRWRCDINGQNIQGQTPLHFVFAYNYQELGAYLIEKGADDSVVNNYGFSCYDGLRPEDEDDQRAALKNSQEEENKRAKDNEDDA